ncbi:hypothetical protein EQG41_18185 [Billgrantia azerbaijanica]|nr:hypothetical protein EQG41_18185 [Halomonas azerbaijanica]
MPKPVNTQRPTWTRAETDALEMLYLAGWSWAAIAVHVSAIHGNPRTVRACRCRGQALSLTCGVSPGRSRHADLIGDLEDLVVLGYSTRQMAAELGTSQRWVTKAIAKHLSPSLRAAWRQREGERRSIGHKRAWTLRKRRAAA